jgi:hypothetical protein
MAADTGGFYARGYPSVELAIQNAAESIRGVYTLSVERPDVRHGRHRLDVQLAGQRYRVHAPTVYFD